MKKEEDVPDKKEVDVPEVGDHVPRRHTAVPGVLSERTARMLDLQVYEAEQNWSGSQVQERSLMDAPTRRPAGPLS